MTFIDVRHKDTGGETSISDEPGVLEWYESRGWEQFTPEPEPPFVPAVSESADTPGFVTLRNETLQVSHDFPNNAEALAGAADAGWTVPKPPKPALRKQTAPKPVDTSEKKE